MFDIDDWTFCRTLDCPDRASVPIRQSSFHLQQYLRSLKGDYSRMLAMRTTLAQENLGLDISRMSDERIIDHISELLRSGLLHTHERPRILTVGWFTRSEEPPEPLVPFSPSQPISKSTGAARPHTIEASDEPQTSRDLVSSHLWEKTPTDGSSTKDNGIAIEFDPAKSEKVKKCQRVVFIQTVQKFADGSAVLPGEFYSGWKYKDDDCLKDGDLKGLRIDYLKGEKTPYYNDPQGVGSSSYGAVGAKNGDTVKATMGDAPDSRGSDKGFYDKDKNPGGYKAITTKFETFAFCAKGPDCGKWYEGVTWAHTQTSSDKDAGSSKITGHPPDPSDGFKKAFEKWNDRYKFKPCS